MLILSPSLVYADTNGDIVEIAWLFLNVSLSFSVPTY